MKLRQKFYFLDYTEEIRITKRIFKILIKRIAKDENEFIIADLIRSLNWGRGVFYKELKSTRTINVKVLSIVKSLDILCQLKLLVLENIFDCNVCNHEKVYRVLYKNENDNLNLKFKIVSLQNDADFNKVVEESGFAPVNGSSQILTKDLVERFQNELKINYLDELNRVKENTDLDYTERMKLLANNLNSKWKANYQKTCNVSVEGNINTHKNSYFFTMFDVASERYEYESLLSTGFIEDRTVCVYGFSKKQIKDRKSNDSKMKIYEARKWSDKQTDRGHFMAHTIGGDIYSNLFPQKRDINRGSSEKGKLYVQMERYLKNNEGVFCFSRPIYFDFSTRPFIIEYGYITKEYELRVEHFENVILDQDTVI